MTKILSLPEVLERYGGEPIRHCPGRYVLRAMDKTDGPERFVESRRLSRHADTRARDTVVVAWLDGWGLISYAQAQGTWVHTANTAEGFGRKLRDLGIPDPRSTAGPAPPVTPLHTNRE